MSAPGGVFDGLLNAAEVVAGVRVLHARGVRQCASVSGRWWRAETQISETVFRRLKQAREREMLRSPRTLSSAAVSHLLSLSAPLPDNLDRFNRDWTGAYQGASQLVLRPRTVEHVQEILRYCNSERLPLVPQGGNTGLVGGSIPLRDEIVLSLEMMNHVDEIDSVSGSLTCQAGCIVQNVDAEARKHGRIYPIDLGSKGSCQVGGNVATNAGGLRVVRYGVMRNNVLGLRALLADGTLVDELRSLKKDTAGLDLKQLLIGSEGALGVITDVCVCTPPVPASTNVALFGVDSFDASLAVLQLARSVLGETLSACEWFDGASMGIVADRLKLHEPFPRCGFYVLVESAGAHEEHDTAKVNALVTQALESGSVQQGVLAQSDTQRQALWKLREGIPVALRHGNQAVLKYDVSLPTRLMHAASLHVVQGLEARGLRYKTAVYEYGRAFLCIGRVFWRLTYARVLFWLTTNNRFGRRQFAFQHGGRRGRGRQRSCRAGGFALLVCVDASRLH